MGLQPARPDWNARKYSGGNQQKILLGRILAGEPRVLILDEPTRGVDVASRADIYRILRQCANQGAAVLFATSEFEEALTLGERILVMREGRISADLTNHPGLTAADLMHHAVPEGQ
jgi:ABC-type sugar transport system ATPase subunit